MIDPVVPALVGAVVPIVVVLARLAHRSAVLRGRSRLTRAAADLPLGARVEARDSAGEWTVSREPDSKTSR